MSKTYNNKGIEKLNDKTVEQKEYEFQGLKLKEKTRSLEVRKNSYLFLKKFQNYAKDWTEKTQEEMAVIEDTTSKKYKYLSKKLAGELYDAMMIFFADKNNLEELFTIALDGEIESIDYNVEDDIKYIQLIEFAAEVFQHFFMSTSTKQT